MTKQIKTKQRVKDFGEVFTNEREVKTMEFDDKIVKLAIQNTIKLLTDNIEVMEEE